MLTIQVVQVVVIFETALDIASAKLMASFGCSQMSLGQHCVIRFCITYGMGSQA